MEREKNTLIREIWEGAKELRLFDEMKRLRNVKDKRMEEVLRQNFQATDSDFCDRCVEERMKEGRIKVKSRSRSASPRLETSIEGGETQKMTYRNVLNVREEPVTKVDRLMKEALGWNTETATYNETKVTKAAWEDHKLKILQLNDEKLGPA